MRRKREDALQTREGILKAAAQIIVHLGVNAFTIEAVAQESGLTKGGVLHHFPSKTALINGLIDQVIEGFNQQVQAALAEEPEGAPGRWLRAYIRTIFSVNYSSDQNLMPALAAAVAADHQILVRIRQNFAQSQQAAIADGLDAIQATLIRLAVDGVVFSRALNIDVLDPATEQAVRDALIGLSQKPLS